MAIVKLGVVDSTPTEQGWINLRQHLNAFIRQINSGQFITDGNVIKMGSYIQHGGVLYQVQGEDYAILGTKVSDVFNYIKISVSGESLIVEYIQDISSYSWSNIYNYLIAGDESQVLAYTEKNGVVYRLEQKDIIYKSNQELLEESTPNFRGLKLFNKPIKFKATDIINKEFASPDGTPYSLTFDGTNLISCDADADKIYVHDGISANILSEFASPSSNPTGLTFDGTNLISCDFTADKIFVHDGVSANILTEFASPGTNPTGLTFDGTNLISCDDSATADKIFVHDGVSANILTEFASPSVGPTGLTFDGTNLISCDNNAGKIYVHDGVSANILTEFASPSVGPTGLTFDGTNLISCDASANKIYVHQSQLII